MVFFVKHKTGYEMRSSDWSADVCSSDLADFGRVVPRDDAAGRIPGDLGRRGRRLAEAVAADSRPGLTPAVVDGDPGEGLVAPAGIADGATALLWSLGDQINHGRTLRTNYEQIKNKRALNREIPWRASGGPETPRPLADSGYGTTIY